MREFRAREEVARHVRPAYMGLVAQVDAHLGRVFARAGRRPAASTIRSSCSRPITANSWATGAWARRSSSTTRSSRVPLIVVDPDARANGTRGTASRASSRRSTSCRPSSTRSASRARRTQRRTLAVAAAAQRAGAGMARLRVLRARLQLSPRARRARAPSRRVPWLHGAHGGMEICRIGRDFARNSSISRAIRSN